MSLVTPVAMAEHLAAAVGVVLSATEIRIPKLRPQAATVPAAK